MKFVAFFILFLALTSIMIPNAFGGMDSGPPSNCRPGSGLYDPNEFFTGYCGCKWMCSYEGVHWSDPDEMPEGSCDSINNSPSCISQKYYYLEDPWELPDANYDAI